MAQQQDYLHLLKQVEQSVQSVSHELHLLTSCVQNLCVHILLHGLHALCEHPYGPFLAAMPMQSPSDPVAYALYARACLRFQQTRPAFIFATKGITVAEARNEQLAK